MSEAAVARLYPEASQAAVQSYVRTCADKLGLRDWTFDIRWRERPTDAQAAASCTPIEGRHYAILRFHPEFVSMSPEEIRHVVAHELAHAHFAQLCDGIQHAVQPWMPSKTYEMFWDRVVLDLEPAVDAVASALTPTLPLIEWT